MITLIDDEFELRTRGDSQPQKESVDARRCCLLCPHRSCCADSSNDEDANKNIPIHPPPATRRLVLSGPPHCGKSSLLFQLAYHTAAQDATALVIYFRVRDMEENKHGCWLPLESCCLLELEETKPGDSFPNAFATSTQPRNPSSTLAYSNPSVLSRILVHHVVTIRDVYHRLLCMASPQGDTKPTMIVLDDLDRLFDPPTGEHASSPPKHHDPHMGISQLCESCVTSELPSSSKFMLPTRTHTVIYSFQYLL
jgi:hypothetical protein